MYAQKLTDLCVKLLEVLSLHFEGVSVSFKLLLKQKFCCY